MRTRLRFALLAVLLPSALTVAVADVIPRPNNCPRGYYPDGNYCVSNSDARPPSRGYYGNPQEPPPGRHSGYPAYQAPPIIEKHGNCPAGYHSNQKGKKCIRDGYED